MLNVQNSAPSIGPHLPRLLFEIGIGQSGCNSTYKKLLNCDYGIVQIVKQKWEEVLNEEVAYQTVENSFKDIAKMKESVYYKYLQFKMLHSRTITNEKLYIMNISDSNLCKMCMIETETMKHAFIDCEKVKELWLLVEKWIKENIYRFCKISDVEKIFGQRSKEPIIDKIIMATKATIYQNKKKTRKNTESMM